MKPDEYQQQNYTFYFHILTYFHKLRAWNTLNTNPQQTDPSKTRIVILSLRKNQNVLRCIFGWIKVPITLTCMIPVNHLQCRSFLKHAVSTAKLLPRAPLGSLITCCHVNNLRLNIIFNQWACSGIKLLQIWMWHTNASHVKPRRATQSGSRWTSKISVNTLLQYINKLGLWSHSFLTVVNNAQKTLSYHREIKPCPLSPNQSILECMLMLYQIWGKTQGIPEILHSWEWDGGKSMNRIYHKICLSWYNLYIHFQSSPPYLYRP